MGNCLHSSTPRANSISSQALSSTPGTSSNHSKSVGFSGTNSTAGASLFSEAASVDVNERYPNGKILDQPNLKEFSFAELKLVTKNFRPESLIGQGGFGKVYKGWVDEKTLAPSKSNSGMVIAIKKLNTESVQGFQEWQAEVNFLGRLNHPNLVKLLGFCWDDEELLLAYEFMPRGSLENHLFGRRSSIEPLSWERRLKIAIGAARGLAFLHSAEKEVIYRDFKASNILLDMDYNSKISDFGLARLGPAGERSHVTTRIMGTYGYVAPEYVSTGHLYVKSDVYGFGVVLLEIMTGLRAHDPNRSYEQRNLVEWAKPRLEKKKKIKRLMDARIEGQYSLRAAALVGDLTLKCLETDPRKRPSMQEVLEALEQVEESREKPKESKNSDSQSKQLHQKQANSSSAK
ncbi:probable serine/threonine-protein kinase PIX13 [Cucurbita pepo subsp. pepo]|uniref:probable serine/threonine-protein kinase PIX13 n=1 Tax=Cucurbita pepo subsp. pepo TaxID=3664 RepID=UPI000C9D6004|nr:probable serine/threonine-protein kinase PIX13 [Cucurbita pepo subsp. pepo]XP_023551882.1 probable serine/threonine-protein kinase PIX13 [Cucurbita pepo subsp. pepo]